MTEQPSSGNSISQFGFAAIIGAPNAGKSTLLNSLLKTRLAITSPKPRTTRFNLKGIVTDGGAQVAFVDTPGVAAPLHAIDRTLSRAASEAQSEADLTLLVADASSSGIFDSVSRTLELLGIKNAQQPSAALTDGQSDADKSIAEARSSSNPPVLVLNKIDRFARQKLLPLVASLEKLAPWRAIFMISALKDDGVNDLRKYVCAAMPNGRWLFPTDMLTDWPDHLIAAEVTREKLMRALHQEIPYGVAVVPAGWQNKKDGSIVIHQTVYVAREGHRPIVLGKGGAQIRAIGEASRHDLAERFGRVVHLLIDVAHDPAWSSRASFWSTFGVDKP